MQVSAVTSGDDLIAVLFAIYQRDVSENEDYDFSRDASDYLIEHMQSLERQALAMQLHALLSNEEEDEIVDHQRQIYGQFLLDLAQDTLDDEAYLRICRETGRIDDLIERLLALGCIDEAVKATEQRRGYLEDGRVL